MRILSLLFFLSSASLYAQARIVDFRKLEVDSSEIPIIQSGEELPLTRPTSFQFDSRSLLGKVCILPGRNADGGVTISVEPKEKKSGFGELRWAPKRQNWNHGPVRIQYWMVPRQENKEGGTFGVRFPETKDHKESRPILGTIFSRAAKIEIRGLNAPVQDYIKDTKYEFDWLLNFDTRTVSLSLNGQEWIKDTPLPDHWVTDRFFLYLFAGQTAGGDADAQWDFGGLVVEEISGE